MNYEEKYNDLLSRIKGMAAIQPDVTRAAIESLFPELRESEERTRKRIIALVNAHGQGMYKDEMLAWLEKQGEQKPTIEMKTPEESLDIDSEKKELKKEKVDNLHNYLYGEQKPAEVRTTGYWHVENVEQNPAWSEEDEERLSDAIFFVREYQIPTRDKRLLNAAKETEDWLKSLKDRYTWKPSKKQMEALLWCVAHLGGADHRVLGELYEHLKKLRGE